MPRYRCEDDFLDEVERQYPFERRCPGCDQIDPVMAEVDFGIGAYEYWGAPGFHTDYCIVTQCCEVEPVEYLGDPEEPDEDLIDESQVA